MSTELFTQSLPDKKRELAERIIARHGTHFATVVFRPEESGENNLCWLEAHEDDRKLWHVNKITTKDPARYGLGEGAEMPERIDPVLEDIYFFDALHYCAGVENALDDQGLIIVNPDGPDGLDHLKAFAAREKIPFDLDTGLPVPVANGHLIQLGTFLPSDRKAARTVQDNLAEKPPRPAAHTPEAPARNLARNPDSAASRAQVRVNNAAQCSQLIQKNENRLERLKLQAYKGLKNDFAHVAKGTQHLLASAFTAATCSSGGVAALMWHSSIRFGADWHLLSMILGASGLFAGVVATIITATCAADSAYKGQRTLPRRAFNQEMKKYRRHVAQLPDSDYKNQMRYAGDEMELLYYKEATIRSFNKAVSGGFLAQQRFNKDLGTLTKIMAAQNISDNRQTAILEEIESGKEANEYTWGQSIKTLIGPAKEALHIMDKQDIPALLAPAARTPKALPAPGHNKNGNMAP